MSTCTLPPVGALSAPCNTPDGPVCTACPLPTKVPCRSKIRRTLRLGSDEEQLIRKEKTLERENVGMNI
eukprot:5062965-Amphidinium_carterae.1